MKNSIYLYQQILKTYWQRPLVLLLTAGFLLIFVVLIFGPTSGDVMQVGARPHGTGWNERVYTAFLLSNSEEAGDLQTFSDLLEHHDPNEIHSLSLINGNVDNPLPNLSLFRNLTYLNLRGFHLTKKNIEQICQLPKLDALVLSQTELPRGALQSVGKKVSQLEISAVVLEDHSDEVSEMSKVKLLALHFINVSTELLELVTQIPQLQQLTFVRSQNFDPNQQSTGKREVGGIIDLNKEQIALLRNCPTLKDVYANWFFMNHYRNIDESAFLPVRALPVTYSKSKINAIRAVFMATGLLFAILALQLWAHFISPAAALVPNYLVPHRRMAVWIFNVGTLFPWLTLLRYDIGILPALSLTLFLPAICCLGSATLLSKKVGVQCLLLPMVLFPCLVTLLFTDLWFDMIAGNVIWFLHGQMPVLALTMILFEVFCVAWSFTRLKVITDIVNEIFLTTPAFSPWDRDHSQQRQKSNPSVAWLLDRDTSKLRHSVRSTRQMISLWRRGSMLRPIEIILFPGVFGFTFLLLHWTSILIKGEGFFSQNFHWIPVVFTSLTSTGVVLPAVSWWQRCKTMELESLRPVNRQSFVKQLYLSMTLDHSWVAIGSLGFFALFVNNVPGGKVGLFSLLLLFSVFTTLWVLGINATILVFKRAWVVLSSMFALYLLAGILITVCTEWVSNSQLDSVYDMPLLFSPVLVIIVAALGLNVLMYRLALNREWG